MEKIKHYFKTYPQSNECFQTTDEFIFHRAWDARAHAETLKDKRVKPWSRHEVARFELAELGKTEEAEAKVKEDKKKGKKA